MNEKKEEEKEKKPFNVILLGNIKSEKEAKMHKLIKKKFAINQIKKLNQSVDSIKDNKNNTDLMNSVDVHGETVKMKIYDNTSANKIFSYSNKNLSNAQGMILYYSVCDRNSFNILKSNLHKIMSMNKYDFPMVMVGNDSDLPNRQVNYEEAKSLADSYGLSFHEVSINSGYGVGSMFRDLGEQVIYREYRNSIGKNERNLFLNNNSAILAEKNVSNNKKNKNISIYINDELYDNDFNKSIKAKMLKKKFNNNTFISSKNKNKLNTNYRTFTNESDDSIILNSFRNNKTSDKSRKDILIKSPDLIGTSSSVILSYQGTTETQRIREGEIRLKRLQREKEMKTWWKKREKENLEIQKLKRLREKKELKEKIKEDKKIQKEKEKKILEESLKKIRLNYEQIKQNNKKMEKEMHSRKESMRLERMQENKSNKEKMNKLKKERDEENEREKQLLKERSITLNSKKSKENSSRNNTKNSLNKKSKTSKFLITKKRKESNNSFSSQGESCPKNEDQEIIQKKMHNYSKKSDLIEYYKNNSNIYRCIKCRLIPDILINEYNQEIEIMCDHSYKDNLHHNITTYSNFIEKSLNHPIDNNSTFCFYCQKYANELSDGKNIFFCQKCEVYFCSDDEKIHKSLMHNNKESMKEKYLNISKNKIKEKNIKKNNSKLMMTPMQNKSNKSIFKQNTTPLLAKKTNNKLNTKNSSNNNDNNKTNKNNDINQKSDNNKKYTLPFYLIDSYCGNHEEVFKFYCFDCHINFCELCLKNHTNHLITKFDDLLLSDEELNSKKDELNKAKEDLLKLHDYFSTLIEAIKCKFERLFNIKKKELEIKEKIIHDYETIKYNFHSINNIRNIKFDNNDNFMNLSPNTDWFTRFNSIFKYLNANLVSKEDNLFNILKSNINDQKYIKTILKNDNMKKINKLILLKNEDIAVLMENGYIKIYDKDNLEEKLNIKLSEKYNVYINDIIQRQGGGLICTGYEFIKFISLGLDNQYFNFEYEINDNGSNINSVIELNNNIIISLNDNSELKLWKKLDYNNGKYEYTCIDCYSSNNEDDIKEEINNIIMINQNSFILSSNKNNCLYKFIINQNEEIELDTKLDDIYLDKGDISNKNIINIPLENYFIVSCIKNILLIDKNTLSIIQKFSHNYQFIDIYFYSYNYFIALDSNNQIYKIEYDKYQQKLIIEDKADLNKCYQISENNIDNIFFYKNNENIILQMKDRFAKVFSLE